MKTLGVIGTAGRGEDGEKLKQAGYWILMRAVAQAVTLSHRPDMLVSGGAAYSDHLAVQLFLEGYAPALRLHLACEFTPFGFKETSSKFDTGRTSNYYHGIFGQHHGLNPYFEIQSAIEKGAITTLGTGFKERNTIIANESNVLLAFTFGDGFILKDGGTKDTMDKFLKRRVDNPSLIAYHFDLNSKTFYLI